MFQRGDVLVSTTGKRRSLATVEKKKKNVDVARPHSLKGGGGDVH